MEQSTPDDVEYREVLGIAIVQSKTLIYQALTDHYPGCKPYELAMFMLSEAGWALQDFLEEYEEGWLDV